MKLNIRGEMSLSFVVGLLLLLVVLGIAIYLLSTRTDSANQSINPENCDCISPSATIPDNYDIVGACTLPSGGVGKCISKAIGLENSQNQEINNDDTTPSDVTSNPNAQEPLKSTVQSRIEIRYKDSIDPINHQSTASIVAGNPSYLTIWSHGDLASLCNIRVFDVDSNLVSNDLGASVNQNSRPCSDDSANNLNPPTTNFVSLTLNPGVDLVSYPNSKSYRLEISSINSEGVIDDSTYIFLKVLPQAPTSS